MSVTEVDAERVFRCAFRLEQVAEDVRTAAARTARCFPDDWRGDAGIAYQQRLDATAERVRRMSVAYDAAGAALVPYARALVDAQDMWRRSESLLAEAEAAEADGPDAAGFRSAAYRLQAEAMELEQRAAVLCAATLDDEAGRAPATSAWRSADRFLGDVAQAGVGIVAGTASLLGTGWRSLPGVGTGHGRSEARHELVESAKAAVSVWNIPIDIRHAMEDNRPGIAFAEAASVLGPGRLSKLDRHRMRDVVLAEKEAFREADRRAALAGRSISRQTAEEMGRNGVDLINEEARGGHVMERHVAASRGFLNKRNRDGRPMAATFRDVATAEQLVNAVLRERAAQLPEVYTLLPNESLSLKMDFPFTTGRVTVKGSRRTIPAHAVTVVLKLEEGEPLVYTAYPDL